MKKIILLFSILFACQNQLFAQSIPTRDTYNITVNRADLFGPGIPGYADTGATFFIKTGTNEQNNFFAKTDVLSKTYTFPLFIHCREVRNLFAM
ncbi:hypothetical protein QFZ37_003556 [Chryseobacterium ginsenosidimutans]|nr:hypothetical protein [Chryseobacterium ginsenosidimutans]